MTTLLYANNAAGTLASGISNASTTVTLNPGQAALFPNPGAGQAFYATFTDAATQALKEIVLVTAVSGNIFSITRAQDSTLALSWNAGDIISQNTIALELRSFYSANNPPPGTLINVQTITTTGVYTPTVGTNSIIYDLLGGGGAGGGASNTSASTAAQGSGGGAGGFVRGRVTSGFSGVTVTIGPGGTGTSAGTGNPGTTSTFGALGTAGGGQGGLTTGAVSVGTPFAGGAGGTASGGFLNIVGQAGPSNALSVLSGVNISGPGAPTVYGAPGVGVGASGNGFAATGFGAGGGGAINGTSQGTPRTGGNGAPGVCIIYEFS